MPSNHVGLGVAFGGASDHLAIGVAMGIVLGVIISASRNLSGTTRNSDPQSLDRVDTVDSQMT